MISSTPKATFITVTCWWLHIYIQQPRLKYPSAYGTFIRCALHNSTSTHQTKLVNCTHSPASLHSLLVYGNIIHLVSQDKKKRTYHWLFLILNLHTQVTKFRWFYSKMCPSFFISNVTTHLISLTWTLPLILCITTPVSGNLGGTSESTGELLKILMLREYPRLIISESLGVEPRHQHFL